MTWPALGLGAPDDGLPREGKGGPHRHPFEELDNVLSGIETGDIRSFNWDGGSDLSTGFDTTATAGYFLDASAGAGQFSGDLNVGGTLQVNGSAGKFVFEGNNVNGGDIVVSRTGSGAGPTYIEWVDDWTAGSPTQRGLITHNHDPAGGGFGIVYSTHANSQVFWDRATGVLFIEVKAGAYHRFQVGNTGYLDITSVGANPVTDVAYDLGSSTKTFRDIYVQNIKDESGNTALDTSAGHAGLSGIGGGEDDHPEYLLADGTRALSGNLDPSGDNSIDLGDATVSYRDIYTYTIKDESGTKAVDTSHGIHLPNAMLDFGGTSLTDDTPTSSSTWEQWGTETIAVTVTAGSTVHAVANLAGSVHDAAATALARCRITFSVDGGSTYATGTATHQGQQQTQSSTQRYSIASTDHFSGTMTSGTTFYIRGELFAPNTTADFVAGGLTGTVREVPT